MTSAWLLWPLAGVPIALLLLTPWLDRRRRAALRPLLRDACEVLDSHGVEYWCDYGTLLGLVRDGDLILGDKDADLCLLEDQKQRVLAAADSFRARGYRLTDRGGAAQRLLRVLDTRTPFYVDIYPYRREGATLVSLLDSPLEDIEARLVERRSRLAAFGTTLPVPAEAEALLLRRYGPGWRTPRRNDKGRVRVHTLAQSVWEDIEASALFVWFQLRRR